MTKLKYFKIQMIIFILRILIDKSLKLKSYASCGVHNLVKKKITMREKK